MRRFKFFFVVIATIAVLSIVGCEKQPAGSDDPNNGAPSISFTLSSTLGVTLPYNYVVESYKIVVNVTGAGQGQGFNIPPPGTTRTFKGDTAKLWLGKDMQAGIVFKIRDGYHSYYLRYEYTPSGIDGIGVFGKVEKTNILSFIITKVEGVNM